jgi:phosphatidylethanolamine/phosphatidyl-N-methylethanolamine N-methyltransferase
MRIQVDARLAVLPAELGRFLRSWVSNPAAVGALAPSGRELARLMARGLAPGHRVLELGAGTGNLTSAILAAGVRPCDLDVVELDSRFVRILEQRFPAVEVHVLDALSISSRLPHLAGRLDFIVSGLPLLLLSRARRMRLLKGAFSLLGPGGAFHQFTYGAKCPVERRMLARLGLKAERIGIAPRNFPPAFAYRFIRIQ